MPVLVPWLIGNSDRNRRMGLGAALGGVAGAVAGRQLAPKPTGQSTTTGAATPTVPATPALPPTTTSSASTNTAVANAAAIRQRRRARGTPTMTTPGSLLGTATARTQPATLLGGFGRTDPRVY